MPIQRTKKKSSLGNLFNPPKTPKAKAVPITYSRDYISWLHKNDTRKIFSSECQKLEKLKDFINNNEFLWKGFTVRHIGDTRTAFETGNQKLIDYIMKNPNDWAGLDADRMWHTLNVFTRVTKKWDYIADERVPLKANKLINDVQEHLPAWFLSSSNEMYEIITKYYNIMAIANAEQGVHNSVIENDSQKMLKYLSKKCKIPNPEQTDEIFNDFKTELDNKINSEHKNLLSDIETLKSARLFMDSAHFMNSESTRNNMTLKQLLAVSINSADNNNIEWADGVETDCEKRKTDIKNLLITALSDSQNAYDGGDVSCLGGAVNRIALALKPLMKQDETAMEWSLSSRDCYDISSNNMIKILNQLNGDNTDIPDTIKQEIDGLKPIIIEKYGDNLNKDNLMKTIYPDIRGVLLKMNRLEYPNVPYLIHSIALKNSGFDNNSGFDDNVEYVNIPDGLIKE